MDANYDFATEIKFTEAYKRYSHEHVAIREIMCLKEQYPAILESIAPGDLFAGRVGYAQVGFTPQDGAGSDYGFYCNEEALITALEKADLAPETRDKIHEMLIFWKKEGTTRRVEAAYTPAIAAAFPTTDFKRFPGIAFGLCRVAGVYADYDKLLTLGIPGLMQEVEQRREAAIRNQGDVPFFTALKMALELLIEVCHFYEAQALALSEQIADPEWKKELAVMAGVLGKIAVSKPETFREAMQLSWLYTIISCAIEFGRMDLYLGDFYARDIDSGIISEDEALAMVESIWRIINEKVRNVDGRVVIGGYGRRNEANADRLALLIMEVSRRVHGALPQLTLRFYQGMDPKLMAKAYETIGAGSTYPILYNDDVNIPAVMKAFEVSRKVAEQYVPLGCGEIAFDHLSVDSPNGALNLLKALEVTLHNGVDPASGKVAGLQLGEFRDFQSFADFWDAYRTQVTYFVRLLGERQAISYQIPRESAAFLYMSLLYDDCLERGKGLFDGGVRYLGGTLELYGNVNTADSLVAIKELVFDQKRLTPDELLTILGANFEGYPEAYKMMLSCPKYGNDDKRADRMLVDLHNFICNITRDQKDRIGLHSYLPVIINNSMNTHMGRWVGATPDGRKAGLSTANANNPSPGMDVNGVTAMLNSIVKPDPSIHAGCVQNMRFSKEMFLGEQAKVTALLDTYFASGGTQAMITVVGKDDLQNAMKEPDKYKDLFVRVGGFSARFVDLAKDVQREIFNRTTY